MPLFRYQCRKCQAEFELLLARFDSEAVCPECGSADLERAQNRIGAITHTGPAGCAARRDCPSAGTHHCCGGCGCGH